MQDNRKGQQAGRTDRWTERGVVGGGRWETKDKVRVRCLWDGAGLCTDRAQWCTFSWSSLGRSAEPVSRADSSPRLREPDRPRPRPAASP